MREDEFVFDEDDFERTIPVKIKGDTYTLKEASGEAAAKYQSMMLSCVGALENGQPTKISTKFADTEPYLVSLCLFDSEDKLVLVKTIRDWPNRIQKSLYKWIKDNSEMQEGEVTVEQLEEQLQKAIEKRDAVKNE